MHDAGINDVQVMPGDESRHLEYEPYCFFGCGCAIFDDFKTVCPGADLGIAAAGTTGHAVGNDPRRGPGGVWLVPHAIVYIGDSMRLPSLNGHDVEAGLIAGASCDV